MHATSKQRPMENEPPSATNCPRNERNAWRCQHLAKACAISYTPSTSSNSSPLSIFFFSVTGLRDPASSESDSTSRSMSSSFPKMSRVSYVSARDLNYPSSVTGVQHHTTKKFVKNRKGTDKNNCPSHILAQITQTSRYSVSAAK